MSEEETPWELAARARGMSLQAAVHHRIARVALEGAEQTEDPQVRLGVLAWAHDLAREHRAAARDLTDQARDLFEQAADLEQNRGIRQGAARS